MPVRFYLFITLVYFTSLGVRAQGENAVKDSLVTISTSDSAKYNSIFFSQFADSIPSDSLVSDSASIDSLAKSKAIKKSGLEDKVLYSADDSMMISVTGEKLYLYGNASIKYLDIELTADYIMLNMVEQQVYACGVPDSAGVMQGTPVFKQGSETFESDSMKYNFESQKGIIYNIISEQGEGFLHSEVTKRLPDGSINIKNGKYTTCDQKHPHFYLDMSKAIVIPEDKIITGPAYMVLADIPIKVVGLPFGFFPNTTRRASGVLLPTFGNEGNRGMSLRDFGWYQVMGEYVDLILQGDYYTRGSWGARMSSSYKWKYHFTGNFSLNYALNTDNEELEQTYVRDYKVTWNHSQDAKANPTQNFSASVNYSSNQYDSRNSQVYPDALSKTKSSSVSYSKRFGELFNLSLSANAVQTTNTHKVDVSLPEGSFNLTKSLYPFRSTTSLGSYRWWENITVGYTSRFKNTLNSTDTTIFKETQKEDFNNGFRHDIPISVNLKVGKLISISPSVSYSGTLNGKYINKSVFSNGINGTDSIVVDTINKVTYAQAINPSISVSFNPKLFGMYKSKKEDTYFMALRHAISPGASFSYTPDMRKINPNYYDTVWYTENGVKKYNAYSHYDNVGMYGTPSSNGQSGGVSLSLGNTLEMKVRPKNDTTGEPKKVPVIDNLGFAINYNPFVDEFNWSDLRLTASTRILDGKLNLSGGANFSPYALDSTGNRMDVFYKNSNGKFFRFTNANFSTGYNLRSKKGGDKDKESDLEQEEAYNPNRVNFNDGTDDLDFVPGAFNGSGYVDFDVPWSLNFNYNWSYTKLKYKSSKIQTLGINGDFSITPKWKIGFNTSIDIALNEMSASSISIYRDLHCWEMVFSVNPFGERQGYYTFKINAKSGMLTDLKYDKKPPNDWYNRY